MRMQRLEAFTLDRIPAADWSGEDKPAAIVDGRVVVLGDDPRPLHGTAAMVVGISDKTFPAL